MVNQAGQYNHNNRSRSKPVSGVNNLWWVLQWQPLQWRCNPVRWLTGPWCPWRGWQHRLTPTSRWMYVHFFLNFCMHSCVIWQFSIAFSIANNGYRNQATNDDWSSARWTICDGIYGAAGYAHSSCCKSAVGPIRCPLNQKTEGWNEIHQDTQDIPHTLTHITCIMFLKTERSDSFFVLEPVYLYSGHCYVSSI